MIRMTGLGQAGEYNVPVVPEEKVKALVRHLYELNVTTCSRLNSFEDINFYIETDEKNYSNIHIKDVCKRYVLKIFNKKDSQRLDLIEAQHAFMAHLKGNGINCQEVVKNRHGSLGSIQTICADSLERGTCGDYWVEVRTFITGQVIAEVQYTPELLFKDGEFVAQLRVITESFKHPFYRSYSHSFSLVCFPNIRDCLFYVKNDDRDLVRDVIDTFVAEVSPKYKELPTGCIHGDLNEHNILVQKDSTVDNKYFIAGVLDYTDVMETFLVVDLAINIAHLMIDASDSLQLMLEVI